MHITSSLAIGASLLSLSEGINLAKRSDSAPRVLQLDTFRKRSATSAPLRDRLRKRADLVSVKLDNEGTLYFANVTIGTPAQSLRLDIDTGSSDLWANSATSDLCTTRRTACSASGTYSANDSSTYEYVNSAFYIQYADGSAARGDYVTDKLVIGGTTLTDVQFGVGYDSSSSQGILGVGYENNEASISTLGETYPNVPTEMVSQGKINTAAYSLWLNDLDANEGSILFGGVDTGKYVGDLSTLPIIGQSGVYQQFLVAMTGLTADGQTLLDSSSSSQAVLLDSGSSLTYLPDSIAQNLYTIFNAQYSSSSGAAIVDCSVADSSATVDFIFSGVNISVPMNELVLVDGVSRGQEVCILGITNAGDSTCVLGDTFLRSAYVVYDLVNNEISLAQTDFNSTTTDVKEITSGSSSVPGASDVPSAVSTAGSVGTGIAGGGPTVSAMSGSGGNSGSTSIRVPASLPYIGSFAAIGVAFLAFAL